MSNPIYRDYLPVKDIPWNTINSYLDESAEIPPLIDDEFLGDAVTTIQLKKRLDLDPWAVSYRNKVLDIVNKLMPVGNVTYEHVAQEHGAWFNKYKHGGKANWHNHVSYVDFVIVWYLQVEDEMGGFVYSYNNQEHVIKVKTGDVLVFPGTLMHSSEPNQTDKDRYLMSNNICITRHTKLDKLLKDQLYLQRQDNLYKLLEQL